MSLKDSQTSAKGETSLAQRESFEIASLACALRPVTADLQQKSRSKMLRIWCEIFVVKCRENKGHVLLRL